MNHHWVSPSRNACHQLGHSPKRRSQTGCSLQWLESKKKTDLRTLLEEHTLSEEGQMVWRNHQNFTILQGTLYRCSTPKGENENLLLFVVPRMHQTATLNECHQDAGHQGYDHTASSCKNVSGGQEWPTDETSY